MNAAIGLSSTIDNDLYGADIAIGVDTALNSHSKPSTG